jgi:hypothetical protein
MQAFVHPDRGAVEWGSPLLSTTAPPETGQHFADRLAGAEDALRELELKAQLERMRSQTSPE